MSKKEGQDTVNFICIGVAAAAACYSCSSGICCIHHLVMPTNRDLAVPIADPD